MKSYFRLYVPLLLASLIAIVLVAHAFFSAKEQPTAKIQNQAPTIQNQAPTEASSNVIGTVPSPVQKSLPAPARREPNKKPLFSSKAAPKGVESNIRQAVHDADVTEANSEVSKENGPLAFSNAKNLRTRALKGPASQETAPPSIASSDVQKVTDRKPIVSRLQKASRSFTGDLRDLPYEKSVEREMPEHEDPFIVRRFIGTPPAEGSQANTTPSIALPAVPAPTPLNVFEGLDRFGFGAGSPPDTNGDVGPNNYIQTVNTSIGIYNKTTGVRNVGLTFNTFMSQGAFGNLCDTNNFGDPVVLYDTFEDRWIITDFAFVLDGGGNVVAPSFQCFAASKTADPIAGGWNFYSIQISDALNDYPKFGIWPDGLYMSSNLFSFGAGSAFQGVRVWAFNKAQMYAGAPIVQNVSFNIGGGDFTIIPSNARLQTGTPPAGRPNLFLSTSLFLNALSVYKFHVDWDRTSLSTLTGPDTPTAATSWPNSTPASIPQPGTAQLLDTLAPRAMVQNQYTNFAGVESLWVSHTVRRVDTSGFAAPRWYQVTVTGGTVAGSIPQATTWDPDSANVIHRWMPSLALDRAGNMALGYSTSNSTTEFPSIKYAGRLSTDPVNTFSLTEQVFFTGTASQTTINRWGDYSGMTLDPNGCTFWYTTEYANPADQTFNHRWLTKFGSFQFSPCTTIGNGTLQGTVTTSPGGLPINGATIAFGARTTTTNGSGFYSFSAIPAGTYPTETASKPGFGSSTTTIIVVADGGTTVKDFALPSAPVTACLVDTTQPDFQLGVPSNTDLTVSAGDVKLASPTVVDQQNTTLSNNGGGFNATTFAGQTFTAALTGSLTKADINLFCSGCTGTTPNLTLSVRATSGGLPTGADLATATIPGFSSGAASYYTGTFITPLAVTAATKYALIIRPVSNPSLGTYAITRSGTSTVGADVYAGGERMNDGGTSGAGPWSILLTGGITTDAGFHTFVNTGFAASGDLTSGAKDSNPTPPSFTRWNSLAWTATVPANTTLRFQIAGSNNPAGPFNFIGPNGTAATFFTTSPANINNLANGSRYLKYKAFFTTTDGAVTPTVSDVTVCFNEGPTAAPAVISGRVITTNGTPMAGVVVRLSGSEALEAITDGNGDYRFNNVDSGGFYTVTPQLANYHFSPANRSFSLVGDKTDAEFTAAADETIVANAIDTPEYFVRQQYLDFLGREPESGGFNYWTEQVNACNGDADCIRARRIDVSAAFFMSQEFKDTGSFVYRLYRGTLGRQLRYSEFSADRAQVVGGPGLEASKTAFADAFVERAEFADKYQGKTTADAFVDALLQTMNASAGVDLSGERAALISRYNEGATMNVSRALAVRQLIDNDSFASAVYNQSFVAMQYFGYLRRSPDTEGQNFWLNVLNNDSGNYRGMICSFITSTEYQRRFSSVVSHSNAECGQ